VTKDIRIAITFPNHPKTIKLRRKIGHKGVDCLLKLWCFCGEYRPKGDMSKGVHRRAPRGRIHQGAARHGGQQCPILPPRMEGPQSVGLLQR